MKLTFLINLPNIGSNSWSSGNVFESEVQISGRANRAQFATGSPPLRYFFERSCVVRVQWRRDGPCQLLVRRADVV